MKKRCSWGEGNALMVAYHDKEWGKPVHNDRLLFEFLILEGFQAGLSWSTILNKRENFRKAFDNFDYKKIAKYNNKKVASLLKYEGIVRNRLKVAATIINAKAYLATQKECGSFDTYIWQFVSGTPKKNKWKAMSHIPATSKESDALSLDLKKRGFKFVGSTIMYAHMQAVGMVNDHLTTCFRYNEV
ncbi:DNA-3-methyladenine glycosylase [bacterium CG10_46_32]|nr:MAG: DNA-3-methyladenine glycosylase [bacterium CG10_46_32]PIR55815.1 MAG: DNA-3-methyladenine glycosylase I [Parcubacteria group bacterium CG10_big_fil_rev_8_21_14_0_10_46_32]